MKKSQIILSVVAFTMAIVGAFTTQANKALEDGKFINDPSEGCITTTQACGSGTQTCVDGSGLTVYKTRTNTTCSSPLKKV